MGELLVIFGIIALVIGAIVYAAFSWGFVCFKFWHWFILPLFPALPHLDFWQCVGLFMFIGLFRNHSSVGMKKEFKEENQEWVAFAIPWMTLGCGWIMKSIIL